MKPKTWPEGVAPTAEQFAAWFVSLDEPDRVAVAERVLESQEAAYRCFVEDHASAVRQLESTGNSSGPHLHFTST